MVVIFWGNRDTQQESSELEKIPSQELLIAFAPPSVASFLILSIREEKSSQPS